MKLLDCIVADDEKLARDVLENYISRVPHLRVVAICGNALEVFAILQKKKVDILFLDIQMPQLNGLSLVRSLAMPPHVVFTTAYQEHAVEAFELRATDYLLKPFSFERFLKAVDKVDPQNTVGKASLHRHYLTVKVNRSMVKVAVDDIRYVEAVGNYTKLHLEEKTIIMYSSLANIRKLLPAAAFQQVHRSYIVNVVKISGYTARTVALGEVELPVGRNFKGVLRSLSG